MKKQNGMTMIGWIVMLAFIGFNGLVAIKIAPVYFTDSSIKSIWEKLETDSSVRGQNTKNLRKLVLKRLRINNIYDFKKDDIKIKKTKGSYIVTLEYEPRGTIAGSLDYIVTFKHEAIVKLK